jgi:hypothetical protein
MLSSPLFLLLAASALAVNFDWERDQLSDEEAARTDAIRFGSTSTVAAAPNGCKGVPGDTEWPSEDDWSSFNETLGGVLLQPKPLASVCYAGEDYNSAKCDQLKNNWAGMNLQ